MAKLDRQDLLFAVRRLPASITEILKSDQWKGKIFIGGGYIRSIISREPINDIDIFVCSATEAELLAHKLAEKKEQIVKTDNAFTIKGKLPIQIIHRWVFEKPEDVSNSFDFTICCAVIFFDSQFDSFCDDRYYIDLASRRLVYRKPIRNEDAGGSMLRVLKYYQKGYRIPMDSLGAVIARLIKSVNLDRIEGGIQNEQEIGKIISGLLREVDPNVDPLHNAHLPKMDENITT